MLANGLVHERLGGRRIVRLVVSAATVAHQINHYVLFEHVAVVSGQLCDEHHRLGVITVDVKDGRFHHHGHIGAIFGRPQVFTTAGGKAYLVVNDKMVCAARSVSPGLGILESFNDQSMDSNRSVTITYYVYIMSYGFIVTS